METVKIEACELVAGDRLWIEPRLGVDEDGKPSPYITKVEVGNTHTFMWFTNGIEMMVRNGARMETVVHGPPKPNPALKAWHENVRPWAEAYAKQMGERP